jgi:hypothetical protein
MTDTTTGATTMTHSEYLRDLANSLGDAIHSADTARLRRIADDLARQQPGATTEAKRWAQKYRSTGKTLEECFGELIAERDEARGRLEAVRAILSVVVDRSCDISPAPGGRTEGMRKTQPEMTDPEFLRQQAEFAGTVYVKDRLRRIANDIAQSELLLAEVKAHKKRDLETQARIWALLDEIKRTIVKREEGRGTD